MKSKQEIKEGLLANCVDKDGDLDLSELDFSDFRGNVLINYLKVGNHLGQDSQEVERNLYQDTQIVDGDLYQEDQIVKGDLYQDNQEEENNE